MSDDNDKPAVERRRAAVSRRPILRLRFPPSTASKSAMPVPASPLPMRAAQEGGGGGPRPGDRLSELQNRFPLAFCSPDAPAPWRPLKIGIHREIAETAPDLANPRRFLRCALGAYVNHLHYLAGHLAGAVRIDLDGNPSGIVTAKQAAAARARSIKGRRSE
jgi:hypothetical protein